MNRERGARTPGSRRGRWRLMAAAGAISGAALLIVTGAGCESPPAGPPETVQMRVGQGDEEEWREVSATQMTRDLQIFANEFSAEVAGTAGEIAAATRDRRVREASLLWRIRTIPVAEAAVLIPDPRQALVAMWLLCAEQRQYLVEGRGRTIFGEHQHLAAAAVEALEDRILDVARRYYSDEQVNEALEQVELFAEQSPVVAIFELYDPLSIDQVEEVNAIGSLLSIPLVPFQAVENIGSTAQEIYRVSLTALAFTRMIEKLPERIRWQAELMMLEFESGDTLTELRRSMAEASSSMASFSRTAEALPVSLRQEFETALESLDAQQAALGQTVERAAVAAADVRAATDNVQTLAGVWNDRLGETRELVQETTDTAMALQQSAGAVRKLIESIDQMMIGARENRREDAPPFDVTEYARAAEEIGKASAELNALLRDTQAADFSGLLVQYDEATRATLDYAQERTEVIVDTITVRLVILLAAIVVIVVLYRIIAARSARRTS